MAFRNSPPRQPAAATPAGLPRLMVPAEQFAREIDERVDLGRQLRSRLGGTDTELPTRRAEYYTWNDYNKALLQRSFDRDDPAKEYSSTAPRVAWVDESVQDKWRELQDDLNRRIRRLESLRERLPLFEAHPGQVHSAAPPSDPAVLGTDVFVVHGHDEAAKTTVAHFLHRLVGQEPVILHEQADRGRTIIEKFEDHAARAACAVVLLTGDDLGGSRASADAGSSSQPRARQNVVLELGFFIGKLGRDRVVILHGTDVELPSDLNGVLYVPLDIGGAWKNQVARELQAAGLSVDLRALLS